MDQIYLFGCVREGNQSCALLNHVLLSLSTQAVMSASAARFALKFHVRIGFSAIPLLVGLQFLRDAFGIIVSAFLQLTYQINCSSEILNSCTYVYV